MTNSTVYDLYDLDISKINNETVYYVNTNNWYWLTYDDAEMAQYQESCTSKIYDIYSNELTMLASSKLTFTEVANLVERQHMNDNRISSHRKKNFRQDAVRRNAVVDDIELSIHQIEKMTSKSTFVEDLNSIPAQEYVDILRKTVLDPTDALMSAFITNNDVVHIITDDIDFYSVSGLKIYTYNKKMLKQASADGNVG